jgi:hypothetical protein
MAIRQSGLTKILVSKAIDSMKSRTIQIAAIVLDFTLVACTSTDRTTFLNYGTPSATAPLSRDELMVAPRVSDGLAINYANSVEIIMRCNSTHSRIAREVSATAQVGLAAFAGIGAAFDYSKTTLTALGLASAAIPQLQGIFNAKGRAEIYNQAADMIRDGVLEYYSHDTNPSSSAFTPNGLTLVKKVAAAISLVDTALVSQLPSQKQMQQAVEPMSSEGTTVQDPSAPPVNARVQTLKTVVINQAIPAGLTRPENIQAVVKSAGDILRSLSQDQAQKALHELKPNAPASSNPQEDILGMLMDTTTMERAVKILTALQHAKS